MIDLPHIFYNRLFKWVAIVVAIAVFVLVTVNIFGIGDDSFLFMFNNSLDAPLAIIVVISAATIWRLMSTERHNRFLWSGMLMGWGLWAMAETIWTVYSALKQEIAYPSLADIFWALGYFPLGIGLFIRVKTLPTKPNRLQNMLIWGFSAITVLIATIFVIMPVIQDFDPQRLVESILNLFYPLADVFLIIVVWRLFFTYDAGDYGFGWRLLTLGFLFLIIGDLCFTYATWQGLYYPDMKANLISRLVVDVPYTLSYLFWFIGIYALRILLKEEHPIEEAARIRMVRTYGHILIYTDKEDIVIGASPNYDRFFESIHVKRKTLAQVLTISEQDGHAILEKLRAQGRVADLPIQIRNRAGALYEIRLCGLAVINQQQTYLGSNLLLRLRVADAAFDDTLDHESRLMARYVLEQSGSNYKAEIGQFLADYYLSYIKPLINMASHQGGAALSQALLDELRKTANQHNWYMQFNPHTVLDSTKYPLEVLREALPVLLETAKQFVSSITDPDIVEIRMREVSSRVSETIHRDVARYGSPDSEVGFSDHREESFREER